MARLQSLGLLLAMGLASCTVSPPPLGSHLPGAFNEASDAFDRRVQQRFAIGSDERELRGALANERFTITRDPMYPFAFSARFTANEWVCRADWYIRWSVFAGNIATISGRYSEICL